MAGARPAALTGQTRIPVSLTKEASMAERHRCQIDPMIDEMVAAGKSEQDILTVIVCTAHAARINFFRPPNPSPYTLWNVTGCLIMRLAFPN